MLPPAAPPPSTSAWNPSARCRSSIQPGSPAAGTAPRRSCLGGRRPQARPAASVLGREPGRQEGAVNARPPKSSHVNPSGPKAEADVPQNCQGGCGERPEAIYRTESPSGCPRPAASASPGNLPEMQTLGPGPLSESEFGWGPASGLPSGQPCRRLGPCRCRRATGFKTWYLKCTLSDNAQACASAVVSKKPLAPS